MDLDIFLRDQNIALYRRLLNSSTDPIQRRTIFKLLAKEMSKLKNGPYPKPFGSPIVDASKPDVTGYDIRDDGELQNRKGDWDDLPIANMLRADGVSV